MFYLTVNITLGLSSRSVVLTPTLFTESAENHHSVVCLNAKKSLYIISMRTERAAVDVVRISVLAKADLNQTSVFSLVCTKFSVVKCSKTVMW